VSRTRRFCPALTGITRPELLVPTAKALQGRNYGTEGREFESLRARFSKAPSIRGFFHSKLASSLSRRVAIGGDESAGPDVEEGIAEALKDGPKSGRMVKQDVAKEIGAAKRTVERAANRIHERGELEIHSEGSPRTAIWTLVGWLNASRTSGDSAVAPFPGTRRGATGGATAQNPVGRRSGCCDTF
jgi:hypothetical protein